MRHVFLSLTNDTMNLMKNQHAPLTVSELNQLIKNILESELLLNDIWVSGEISNLRRYSMGKQIFFSLMDGQSQVNCVLYDNFQKGLAFEPQNGMLVQARGKIKVFHRKGTYTLQVAFMLEAGQGKLSSDFDKLKQRLNAEGLFSAELKKAIPKYPERIGLITAQDSAAFWDFVRIAKASAPHLKLTLIPAVMQGPLSPESVIEGVTLADRHGNFDTVVVLRGGR